MHYFRDHPAYPLIGRLTSLTIVYTSIMYDRLRSRCGLLDGSLDMNLYGGRGDMLRIDILYLVCVLCYCVNVDIPQFEMSKVLEERYLGDGRVS
jgi:hypothetical protein